MLFLEERNVGQTKEMMSTVIMECLHNRILSTTWPAPARPEAIIPNAL